MVRARPEHHADRKRVAEGPVELGHELKVHAVDARHHRRHRDDRRPARQALHRLVLRDRDEREVRLEGRREELAQHVHHLGEPDGVVVDVAEVGARVLGDQQDVGPHEPGADVHERRDRAFHLEEITLEAVDALGRLRAEPLVEDRRLERLQPGLESTNGKNWSTTKSMRAWSTNPGPFARSAGVASHRTRTSARGADAPWRTVTTYRGPTKMCVSPSSTPSAPGASRAVRRTTKSESP